MPLPVDKLRFLSGQSWSEWSTSYPLCSCLQLPRVGLPFLRPSPFLLRLSPLFSERLLRLCPRLCLPSWRQLCCLSLHSFELLPPALVLHLLPRLLCHRPPPLWPPRVLRPLPLHLFPLSPPHLQQSLLHLPFAPLHRHLYKHMSFVIMTLIMHIYFSNKTMI